MTTVLFTGWNPGLAKIQLTKLFQARAGLRLSSAKDAVDQILEGKPVTVTLGTADEADSFVRAAQVLGAVCFVL